MPAKRKKCQICSMEIPPRPPGKRGAPQTLCAPDTGRPCALLSKRLKAVEKMVHVILQEVPSAAKGAAAYRIRTHLRGIEVQTEHEKK